MTERDQAAADAMVRPDVASPGAARSPFDATGNGAGGAGDRGTSGDGTRDAQHRGVAEQILDEVRHAAEALIDEQRARAADTVHDVADALRQTAETLTRENNALAQYADRAAERVDAFSSRFREQRWSDLVAEAEVIAHRQPMLFLAGAVAMGFVAGRLMSADADRTGPSARPAGMAPRARDMT